MTILGLQTSSRIDEDGYESHIVGTAEEPLYQPLPLVLNRLWNTGEAVPRQVGHDDSFVDQKEIDLLRSPGPLAHSGEFLPTNETIEKRGLANVGTSDEGDDGIRQIGQLFDARRSKKEASGPIWQSPASALGSRASWAHWLVVESVH